MTGRVEGREPPSMLGALQHQVPPPSGDYRWVYLWHWPIRAMHWAAAGSIVLLVITGFIVGRPYFMPQGEFQSGFFIGWTRLVHFIAAGILVATAIVRLYWLIAGNKFERLPALFPIRPRDWANMFRQVKFYLMIHPEKAPHYLGHNPLQQLAYTSVYLAAAVMVITGFALYGQATPGGVIRVTTTWVPALFGGMQNVRLVHHVLTWYFIMFVPIHLYLAMRADILERGGTLSSIFTGGRFVTRGQHFIDDEGE